jgi:hypothetical protein
MNRTVASWATRAISRAIAGAGVFGVCVATQACVSGESTVPDAGMEDEGPKCVMGGVKADGTCVCDEGWTGDKCDRCAADRAGPNCELPACDGGDCNWCGDTDGACEVHQDDGVLEVTSGETNLSISNHPGRTCNDGGDAVAYAVVSLGPSSATLDRAPSTGCLVETDEVLLINLRGGPGAIKNVGSYESLHVASIQGATITFKTPKRNAYGSDAGSDQGIGPGGTQTVILQRVPNYRSLSVANGASLTANAWDGSRGGVLAVRVMGKITVAGTLSMTGRGYLARTTTNVEKESGWQGEGPGGPGIQVSTSNLGGGGGGQGDDSAGSSDGCMNGYGSAGGGGGHGTAGGQGGQPCSGQGGAAFGRASSSSLELGAAGGSGGADDYIIDNPAPGTGGAGGGAILMDAAEIEVTGRIQADGNPGVGDSPSTQCVVFCGMNYCPNTDGCYDFSGPGGGGAGGTVVLRASTLRLGASLVTARGGAAGVGDPMGNERSPGAGSGGAGGSGRIFTAGALTGTTDPGRSNAD